MQEMAMEDAQVERPQSFREAKAEALAQERGAGKPEIDPVEREIRDEMNRVVDDEETLEDVVDDSLDDNASEDTPADESDLEDEAVEEIEADDTEDYQVRFEKAEKERSELEKQLSKLTENRSERDAEFARSQEEVVRMKHSLTDDLEKARQGAEFYANLANQQVAQFQNINWAAVPPDQVQQLQMQAQQAMANAQQYQQGLDQFRQYEHTEREKLKQRDAELAASHLRATIPEWSNDHYTALGEIAGEYGYTREEYAEITDHRLIRLLHKDWQSRQAMKTVEKKVTQRKAKPPRGRTADAQPRNARGEFMRAKKEFEAQPNKRGNFAAMKLAEMRKERR